MDHEKITAETLSDKAKGLICPKCECRSFGTENTVPNRRGTITRYKECRNCGERVRTMEKITKPYATLHEIYRLYREQHTACPKCGKRAHSIEEKAVFIDDAETGKDENDAWCACGWKGIVNDLVPLEESNGQQVSEPKKRRRSRKSKATD